MPAYRVSEAARLLGISDDWLRRNIDLGRVEATHDAENRLVIDGAELARFAVDRAPPTASVGPTTHASARNRFVGLVTRVVRDSVMAQVDLQCGPYRVVSLMSREAADHLGLEPGVTAAATVKSTNVVVEIPQSGRTRRG